ncbi:MAG: ImmA/IrrE family metallo-endopeptidase [bacterium]
MTPSDEIVGSVPGDIAELGKGLVTAWPTIFEGGRWPIPTRAADGLAVWDELQARRRQAEDAAEATALAETITRFERAHRVDVAALAGLQLFIARDEDEVALAWRADPGSLFLAGSGNARISAPVFLGAVKSLVRGLADGSHRAWLEAADSAPGAERVVMGQAGLDEAEVDQLLGEAGVDFARFFAVRPDDLALGSAISANASPVAMMFRSASPDLSVEDRLRLRALVVASAPAPRARDILAAIRARLPRPDERLLDHDQGYAYAATVRRWLGRPDGYLDVEAVLTGTLAVPVEAVELGSDGLDGGCVEGEAAGPLVFVNTRARMARSSWGRRMTLAHELCHLLLDRPPQRALAHTSTVWAPPGPERRANAFAAELLLPVAGIRRMRDEGAGYRELMEAFGVGQTTAMWHVRNRLGEDLLAPIEPAPGPGMQAASYLILFVILAKPDCLDRSVEELAAEAGASPRVAREVLTRLRVRGWLARVDGRHRLTDPDAVWAWWLVGYTDQVRPAASLRTRRVRLPAGTDAALAELARRLDRSRTGWWWGGEAGAWQMNRDLHPGRVIVHVDANDDVDVEGDGEREVEVEFLQRLCPAEASDPPGGIVSPVLIESELRQTTDPRVLAEADAIAQRTRRAR